MFYNLIYTPPSTQRKNINKQKIKNKILIILFEIALNLGLILITYLVAKQQKVDIFTYLSGTELFWSAFIIFSICAGENIVTKKNINTGSNTFLAWCLISASITLVIFVLLHFKIVGNSLDYFIESILLFIVSEIINFISVL